MANIAPIMENMDDVMQSVEKQYVPTTELDVRYHYNVTRDAYSLSDHSSVAPGSASTQLQKSKQFNICELCLVVYTPVSRDHVFKTK